MDSGSFRYRSLLARRPHRSHTITRVLDAALSKRSLWCLLNRWNRLLATVFRSSWTWRPRRTTLQSLLRRTVLEGCVGRIEIETPSCAADCRGVS
jgi:hypothetical protein